MPDVADRLLSRRAFAVLLGSAAGSLIVPVWLPAARAQDVGTMERGLSLPRRRRRGLGTAEPPTPPAAVRRFKEIRRRRGLNHEEREELTKLTDHNPQIDFPVYFAFNSSEIEPQAAGVLNALGEALGRPALRGQEFGVFGHTDAVGSAEYNQELSERRAEAVKAYLVRNFGIDPDTLLTAGYGFERLKNRADPYADENRRVQVVNLSADGG